MTQVLDFIRRRGGSGRTGGRVMLKLAMTAAAVFLVLSPTPSRADCPDGYCPNGTRLDSVRQREAQAARARAARKTQCVNGCTRAVCGNLHVDICFRENWGRIRSCQANCR